MDIPQHTFKTFSDLLLNVIKDTNDVTAKKLRNTFVHFMQHSFNKNNIEGCNECKFLNSILRDHLSKDCFIKDSGRCYFHEIVEHIVICRHMILMGSHPSAGCRTCQKSAIYKQYREKFLHASTCRNQSCNSSCQKWKHFIQHLKMCSGCWLCEDENYINSVYLKYRSESQQRPPAPTPSGPVIVKNYRQDTVHTGIHPQPNPAIQRMTNPTTPQNAHPSIPPQNLPHASMPPQNRPHPNMHPSSLSQQNVHPSAVPPSRHPSISHPTILPQPLHQPSNLPPQKMVQPMNKSVGYPMMQQAGTPIMSQKMHPNANVSSTPNTLQNLSQRPNYQGGLQTINQAKSFDLTNKSTVAPIMEAHPSRSFVPNLNEKLRLSVREEMSRAKLPFDSAAQTKFEMIAEKWLKGILTRCIQNAYKKNGKPIIKGLKIRSKNRLEGYVRRRHKEEVNVDEKRNIATIDMLCSDKTDKIVITADDIRNYVRCNQSAIATCLRQNTVI